MSRPIALIGPRGVGKTAVGRVLADRLARPFVDLDDRIRARAGRPLRTLFEERGEPAFRVLEHEALQELTHAEVVVATGGGIVTHEPSRRLLGESFLVVGLLAPPDVLGARLAADPASADRPPLAPGGFAAEARHLLNTRLAGYLAVAAVHFSTVDCTPTRIADEVVRWLLPLP